MDNILFPDEKTGLYVSGHNMNFLLKNFAKESQKEEFVRFEYDKFREFVMERSRLVACKYYFNNLPSEYHDVGRKLADKLAYNGWRIIGREQIVRQFNDAPMHSHNPDPIVEMAIDIVNDSEHLDHMIVVTNDSNIVPAINYAATNCCRMTVVSDVRTCIGRIDDLRRSANEFIQFSDLNKFITSTPK